MYFTSLLLPPHSQWFNHLFDQLGIGFFDLFFVAEWVEGVCYFCLVVFVALALGQLAFAGLFFGTFAVVLDIVAQLVGSDIPVFGKAYNMAIDDGFDHLVQDSGNGLSSVAFRLFLDLGPEVLDDLR